MSGSNEKLGALKGSPASWRLVRWGGAAALACASLLVPRVASACGGFFCSAAQPVNQAAERIVFANNGDGTVTAVIEIQYQGPSESFSWLLPISSVPAGDQIAVASNLAFQRLQAATNPQYTLTTRVEGTCDVEDSRSSPQPAGGFASGNGSGPSLAAPESDEVTVEGSGVVGSFEWTVISVRDAAADPAATAVEWLGENGYDVPAGAPGLLGPYLEDGMYLLALKLKKGADAGSIRPIVLTYEAEQPMIPIKLTAVAANDDMGVLAFVLGESRAVPQNYNSLELNEARINWFNAGANYNQVVVAAANDAGGHGFVTELAGTTATLANTVWTPFDEQRWSSLRALPPDSLYAAAASDFAGYDGFRDVLREHVIFPAGVTAEQAEQCPFCFPEGQPDADFLSALEADVVEPIRLVQALIDAHPQVTRLYTTLSAAEMTVDPVFTLNPDLPAVSNVHQAERVIECRSGYYQSTAPWRIELPSGGVVRGGPSDVGVWPSAFDAQPANQRISRQGESGAGRVLEDNTAKIQAAVNQYNASVATPAMHSSGGCSFGGVSTGGMSLAALALAWGLGRRRRPRQSRPDRSE
jgi:Uncharacterized protein conserved in bacteria (DUF2330)